MYRDIVSILFVCLSFQFVLAQTQINRKVISGQQNSALNDSISKNRVNSSYKDKATIDMYLKFNSEMDTIAVDTSLSIYKDYKFNYLQKDNFGLMPFANIGQSYNSLFYDTTENRAMPLFAARGRHFNYLETSDIKYYRVPTPWTRLTYKTAFEQGQLLDAFFTVNLSKKFNFSIAYKGLRSLGNYQNALTSSGNFRFTSNYSALNNRYNARGHIVMQDLLNQENGGLTNEGLEEFTTGDEEFLDRSVFDPNFQNAENILEGKRFYFEHSFDIVKQNDSLNNNSLKLINQVSFEDKYFQFYQTSPTRDFFGETFTSDINDKVTIENFHTQLGLQFDNGIIGNIGFGINYTDVNYGYNTVVIFPTQNITNRIKSNFLGLNASYEKTIGEVNFRGKAIVNLSDTFSGNVLDANLDYNLNRDFNLAGSINISSKLPNYNYLLYQSDYINYNWYNLDTYSNINTQKVSFIVKSKKFFNAKVDFNNIENYTYFSLEETIENNKIIKPKQFNGSIQYVNLKIQREFKVGNFALDNTIMYQSVVSDEDVLNVPAFVTRNTLYYSNQIFKKAMTLQTGITFNYFSKYNMNGYDPLLAEFYTQNETALGGFPRLDFFINAKIRQTRIFLKAEHFNSSFTGYDYFSAPNHPYRDFTIRFGLVWDFFL